MKLKSEILTELQQIAPKLALLEKTNPYKVPEGYFINFKNILSEKLKFNEVKSELKSVAPELSNLEVNNAIHVQEEYFNNFSARLINKIREIEAFNELRKVASELSKIEKANVFEVPADYFNALPARILNNAVRQKANVAATSKWVESLNEMLEQTMGKLFKPKYTFAFAGLATVLIIVVMTFIKVNTCNDLDCKLAQLSTEEINAYLERSDVYSDEIFEMNLDDKAFPVVEKDSTLNIYKDALKDVNDAALNEAISD